MTPDNEIRIPSSNYLDPYIKELTELYACQHQPSVKDGLEVQPLFMGRQNPQACSVPEEGFPARALHIYENALLSIKQVVSGMPLLRDRFNAPEIGTHTSVTMFDDAHLTLQESCERGIPVFLPQLHDAFYWSKRAGFNDAQTVAQLQPVTEAFQSCWETSAGVLALQRLYSLEGITSFVKVRNYPDTYYSAILSHALGMRSLLSGIATLVLSSNFDTDLELTAQTQWTDYETIDVLMSAPFPKKSLFELMAKTAKEFAEADINFPISPDELDRRLDSIHKTLRTRSAELKGEK